MRLQVSTFQTIGENPRTMQMNQLRCNFNGSMKECSFVKRTYGSCQRHVQPFVRITTLSSAQKHISFNSVNESCSPSVTSVGILPLRSFSRWCREFERRHFENAQGTDKLRQKKIFQRFFSSILEKKKKKNRKKRRNEMIVIFSLAQSNNKFIGCRSSQAAHSYDQDDRYSHCCK